LSSTAAYTYKFLRFFPSLDQDPLPFIHISGLSIIGSTVYFTVRDNNFVYMYDALSGVSLGRVAEKSKNPVLTFDHPKV
jgi:hypothetical protein